MGILRRFARWFGMEGEMTNIVAGNIAPNFSLKALDGKAYSLSKLLERGPVLATFFKVSCPVCQFTLPFVQRIFKKYSGDNVTILGVSQDDAKSTKEFAAEYGVTFPLVTDEKGYPVSNAYTLTMVPSIFLINTDGTVKISSMGFVKKDLESMAAELAERRKMAPAPLFLPNESVPANKPG